MTTWKLLECEHGHRWTQTDGVLSDNTQDGDPCYHSKCTRSPRTPEEEAATEEGYFGRINYRPDPHAVRIKGSTQSGEEASNWVQ